MKYLKNDAKLRNDNDLYKHYLAPDIPEKVIKGLIKYYYSHLPVNSIVAFYDSSLFGTSKTGLLFTNDGMYYNFVGKPVYIHYADIIKVYCSENKLVIDLNNEKMPNFKVIEVFNMEALEVILKELISIDAEHGQSSFKSSGKVKKLDLPQDILKKCNTIIHGASVACGGVGTGLAQIPTADNAVIVPIQIAMIVSLGAVFELHITEGVANGIIASAGATFSGRRVSQFLVGWIPGIGNAINTATAAGLTEAIGWIAVQNFYKRWIEDRQKGRYEGMKDGYTEASGEYERKLRKQAQEFLDHIKDIDREREEYENLLDEYEKYIVELEKKCASFDLLNEMKGLYNGLNSVM